MPALQPTNRHVILTAWKNLAETHNEINPESQVILTAGKNLAETHRESALKANVILTAGKNLAEDSLCFVEMFHFVQHDIAAR